MNDINQIILYSDEDIDSIKLLSDDELQNVIMQIACVGKRINNNYEFLKNANWYQRMIYSISRKTRRTEREITKDQSIISMYCMQLMKELVNRNIVSHIRISTVENKVNELYSQFTKLARATGQAVDAVDEYSTFILGVLTGYYKDDLVSAIRISQKIKYMNLNSEKAEISFNAIKKNICSKERKLSEWLSEIKDFNEESFKIYYDFYKNNIGTFPKIIELCLILKNEDCFDLEGAQEVLGTFNINDDLQTLDSFILRILKDTKAL